jgi:hypothetical protein
MEPQPFEALLRGLAKRVPFRPFTVELVNGERVKIDHPEAVVIRAGVAVYLDSKGVPSWFDHEGVNRIIGAVDKKGPAH